MRIIDFDPEKHKGRQLYALQTVKEEGGLATIAVPTDVSFEDAQIAPWHYVVDADEKSVKDHDYQWQLEFKYSPDQPRDPAGTSTGGQWTESGGWSAQAFGEWAVDLQTGDLKGFRGVNRTGIGFGSTEGEGIYIARDRRTAQFFAGQEGQVKQVKFAEPKRPFVVDNEELYLLTESDLLEQPPAKSDSSWLAANKRAVAQMYQETGGKWDPGIAAGHLTDYLKKQGHDAVYVRAGSEEWVVLFDSASMKDSGQELEWQLEVQP